jgi:hypothetical protein
MIRIDNIKIVIEPDTDCSSELGEYSSTPGPDDRTIDRQERGDQQHGQYRYWIAEMSGEETGNPESVEQDYKRAESLNRGEWCFEHLYVRATVSYDCGHGCRRIERLKSAGIGGIESDESREDKLSTVREELEDLRTHLARFNVDLTEFNVLAEQAIDKASL